MKQELFALYYSMVVEGHVRRYNEWWVSIDPPTYDFNREIVEHGINETYTEGLVGIRVDDDFWQVAALPLQFRELSIEEIVPILWPDIENPAFNADSADFETAENS